MRLSGFVAPTAVAVIPSALRRPDPRVRHSVWLASRRYLFPIDVVPRPTELVQLYLRPHSPFSTLLRCSSLLCSDLLLFITLCFPLYQTFSSCKKTLCRCLGSQWVPHQPLMRGIDMGRTVGPNIFNHIQLEVFLLCYDVDRLPGWARRS